MQAYFHFGTNVTHFKTEDIFSFPSKLKIDSGCTCRGNSITKIKEIMVKYNSNVPHSKSLKNRGGLGQPEHITTPEVSLDVVSSVSSDSDG
jgi:hypothetical protein